MTNETPALTAPQAKALEAVRKACAETGRVRLYDVHAGGIGANRNAVRSLERKGLVVAYQDEEYRWYLKLA